jgi:opacity protein-like surface antigen
MRSIVLAAIALVVCVATADAQSAAAQTGGYAEGFFQASFGNVTSQSFGAEGGIAIVPDLMVFVEAGRTRDAATSDIGASAQKIAGSLSGQQSGVSYAVKQPVTYFDAGIRWYAPVQNPNIQPYAMAGFGLAHVEQNAQFFVNGTDVTANLQQYSIVLGSDLSGSVNKALLTLGGGVAVPVWHQVVADLQFRYGRIFSDPGMNMTRAGVGIGVQF